MAENSDILTLEGLCKYFKIGKEEFHAVENVSFSVKRGEVFGLVGESGCGKTTLGRTVIGLYTPTSGNIYFEGKRISAGTRSYYEAIEAAKKQYRLSEGPKDGKDNISEVIDYNKKQISYALSDNKKSGRRDMGIQMIFQDPISSLDPRMTVREIIAEGLIIKGTPKDEIYKRVNEMLEWVGLRREYGVRYPHEFSGGQRQRIGIARALIMEPKLVIADEPVSALDVSVQAQVINLMDDLKKRMGLTLLFIAHDLSVVKYISDRIGVMYKGQLIELAPAEELFENPIHPYTKSLLSAIPVADPIYERGRKRIVYEPPKVRNYGEFSEVSEGHYVMRD